MRLANEIAAAAMEHCRLIIEPGMTEAQIAAEWEGFVHGEGTGWEGKVDLALGFSLVWSGPGSRRSRRRPRGPWSRASRRCSRSGSAPTATGATTRRTSSSASSRRGTASSRQGLMAVYEDAIDFARPGASLAELDRRVRAGIDALGFPGQPSHPICHGVGARAHEPPYAHQAGGGEIAAGMVLAIEPGCYIEGGGGLAAEDNFLITETAPRSSRRSPTASSRASVEEAQPQRPRSGRLQGSGAAGTRASGIPVLRTISAGRERAGSCRRRSAAPAGRHERHGHRASDRVADESGRASPPRRPCHRRYWRAAPRGPRPRRACPRGGRRARSAARARESGRARRPPGSGTR